MFNKIQRLTSFVVAAALVLPMSAFAEKSSRGRTVWSAPALPALSKRRQEPPHSKPSAEALVDAMNRERARHGLRPLRLNQQLSQAAGDRVDDMFAKRYFDHVSPDGIDPFAWAERRGYDYRAIGENLATGYRSSTRVVDGWMRSPGHRANILGRSFDEVGIAVADGAPIRGFAGPLVVAMYGAR